MYMNAETNCPYCGNQDEVDVEYQPENEDIMHECESCGTTFRFQYWIEINTTNVRKSSCGDGNHKWKIETCSLQGEKWSRKVCTECEDPETVFRKEETDNGKS